MSVWASATVPNPTYRFVLIHTQPLIHMNHSPPVCLPQFPTAEEQPQAQQTRAVLHLRTLKHTMGVGGESSVKWPLLPRSSLEQKHTNSLQQEWGEAGL